MTKQQKIAEEIYQRFKKAQKFKQEYRKSRFKKGIIWEDCVGVFSIK